MSNTYFCFKQFNVAQDRCAMKVSTDACIQGAWTPVPGTAKRVLDMGCGTGLLSLMLAQRNHAIHIDGVELDPDAAAQADENVMHSPFADHIDIWCADIRDWSVPSYDLIICNPPFFNNSLLGDEAQRNQARHTLTFSQEDMLRTLDRLLSDHGQASILLPVAEQQQWEQRLRKHNWHIRQRLIVQPFAHSRTNRVVSVCSRERTAATIDETLVIYEAPKQYTAAFTALMRDYYLFL